MAWKEGLVFYLQVSKQYEHQGVLDDMLSFVQIGWEYDEYGRTV
jgi:hypothetical protein